MFWRLAICIIFFGVDFCVPKDDDVDIGSGNNAGMTTEN